MEDQNEEEQIETMWIFGALVGHDRILKMIKIVELKEKIYTYITYRHLSP